MSNQKSDSPENTLYPDTGCEVFPSCLRCPLPVCKYDNTSRNRPSWLTVQRKSERNLQVLRAIEEELLPKGEVARQFGISRKTLNKILRAAKHKKG